MIEYLTGKFAEKNPAFVVVDVNGLGYMVQVSLNTYSDVNGLEEGTLLIQYSVSVDVRSGESKHQLFGFSTNHERQLFRQLVTISGVSSGIAHMILSSFKPDEFQSIVFEGDIKTLTSVKGIGPKLAQKVIAELADKIVRDESDPEIASGGGNSLRQEALSALTALGFDRGGSAKVINQLLKSESPPESVEDLVKTALKKL
ncbi:MAG: Holliday junction branch migration protein RuvA [Flavobacteriales bacterium]|jgi:Holliday junction DNA helicase RuvA|nr:Holliday junction branch migration protein RuvA [Flavobacteriales bacterium]NCG28906.1 Holliday junction branch migration protein RuvA [Bacteroidota bacterium]MBT3962748.1 Holliday junction branch migration protein RuvA [Flavobacteriales bacterium]MBT4705901.1 Holliday junction branch migration protein RuvA [Flavobacteriales bacterium]MBT4929569.1 Holliday junction branch migration protein RuvA [Flavobacteriales bacterium]